MEAVKSKDIAKALSGTPTLKNFVEQFGVFKQCPGGIDKIRKLILRLAVSGRLTHKEADADVENEIMQALDNKEKYEKKLKLRKNKPLQNIEDAPYEIPSHWTWCKLEDLACYIQRGKGPKYDDENTNELVVSQKCIQWEGFSLDKARGTLATSLEKYGQERFLKNGDLLWNSTGTGTVGRIAIIDSSIDKKLVADSHVTVIRLSNMESRYIWCCIANPWVQDRIEPEHEDALVSGSTKQVELSTTAVRSLPIPVAPIEEQKRIVAKVDELMALCDQLEAQQQQQANTLLKANTAAMQALLSPEKSKDDLKYGWQRLADNFHILYGNTLPMPPGEGRQKKHLVGLENLKQLKLTILELAMLGRLTSQDYSFTSTDIVEKLITEGERLRQEKGIRKVKPISLTDEFIPPQEIPKNWQWVSLDSICYQVTDGAHHTPTYTETGVPFISVKDLTGGGISFDNTRFISKETHEELSARCNPEHGDMLLTKVGTTGVARTIDVDRTFSIFVSVALLKFYQPALDTKFFEYLLNSPLVKKQSDDGTQGVGNKNLVLKTIRAFHLPIPPLEEQKRIVAKVDEHMALCDQLEQQLTTAYDDAEKLITATTKALVA